MTHASIAENRQKSKGVRRSTVLANTHVQINVLMSLLRPPFWPHATFAKLINIHNGPTCRIDCHLAENMTIESINKLCQFPKRSLRLLTENLSSIQSLQVAAESFQITWVQSTKFTNKIHSQIQPGHLGKVAGCHVSILGLSVITASITIWTRLLELAIPPPLQGLLKFQSSPLKVQLPIFKKFSRKLQDMSLAENIN